VLFTFEDTFPEDTTNEGRIALQLILQQQVQPGGGFHSVYVDGPNAEETALAIIALKAAVLSKHLSHWERDNIQLAIERAEAYLWNEWKQLSRQKLPSYVNLWAGKMPYCAVHVVNAIILAALILKSKD